MKFRLAFGLALVLACLFTGCHGLGTQRFTAFAPAQCEELKSASRIVLDVKCTNLVVRTDYNLWENLQMLAPRPKHWRYSMTLEVERVLAGEFESKTLTVHSLREPTPEQAVVLGFSEQHFVFTNGLPLQIGFDGLNGEHLRNLKILVRQAPARLTWPAKSHIGLAWPDPPRDMAVLNQRFAGATPNRLGTVEDVAEIQRIIPADKPAAHLRVREIRWLSPSLAMARVRAREAEYFYVVQRRGAYWIVLTYYLRWIS